jgi:hypothetical protein
MSRVRHRAIPARATRTATPSSHQTGPQTVDIAPAGGTTINFFYYTLLA